VSEKKWTAGNEKATRLRLLQLRAQCPSSPEDRQSRGKSQSRLYGMFVVALVVVVTSFLYEIACGVKSFVRVVWDVDVMGWERCVRAAGLLDVGSFRSAQFQRRPGPG